MRGEPCLFRIRRRRKEDFRRAGESTEWKLHQNADSSATDTKQVNKDILAERQRQGGDYSRTPGASSRDGSVCREVWTRGKERQSPHCPRILGLADWSNSFVVTSCQPDQPFESKIILTEFLWQVRAWGRFAQPSVRDRDHCVHPSLTYLSAENGNGQNLIWSWALSIAHKEKQGLLFANLTEGCLSVSVGLAIRMISLSFHAFCSLRQHLSWALGLIFKGVYQSNRAFCYVNV